MLLQNLGSNCTEINLASNEIEKIDINNYELVKYKTAWIDLDSNPILCDCFNFDFFQLLHTYDANRSLKFAGMEDISCSLFHLDKFKCEILVEHGCPEECVSCNWIPFSKSIVFDCSNSSLEHYPTINTTSIKYSFHSTILHLENNNLTEGPINTSGYFNITELYLSDNQINNIEWLPINLKVLHLHNNKIKLLNSHILKILETSPILNLTLYGNPWICDCEAKFLLKFISNFSHKVSYLCIV